MSSTGRFVCILYITLIISLISETNGQKRVGEPGVPGDPGPRGDKGQKGEKGDVGPFAKTKIDDDDDDDDDDGYFNEPSIETARPIPGGINDPATSCRDNKLMYRTGEPESFYIYPANPFKVRCIPSEGFSACLISEKPKKFDETVGYKFSNYQFWLSTARFDLLDFYHGSEIKHISQLKYLVKTSSRVSIEIVVHCKNTEISADEGKYLRIHLWDGRNVGPFTDSMSSVDYEIPDELNECKDFTDETKWKTATINLNSSSTFITDFYIRDIKKGKEQGIYIELKKMCFY